MFTPVDGLLALVILVLGFSAGRGYNRFVDWLYHVTMITRSVLTAVLVVLGVTAVGWAVIHFAAGWV